MSEILETSMKPSPRALFLSTLCFVFGVALQAEPWKVPESEWRFEYRVSSPPSHPEGGVLLRLPDGGILPSRFEAVAYDGNGERLETFLLWHNRSDAAGILVSAPSRDNRRVLLYLRPDGNTRGWTERGSRLRPGPLLYTEEVASPSFRHANALAEAITGFNNPTANARMDVVPNLFYERNPFGRDERFVSYFTGWLNITEEGEYYFASVTREGAIVSVNGNQVVRIAEALPREQMHAGQRGGSVRLRAGFHRLENVHFYSSGRTPEMIIAWRTPGMGRNDLPAVVPGSAFVRTGRSQLADAWSRQGLSPAEREGSALTRAGVPPAVIEAEAVAYLWPDEGREPMNLFSIRAWNHGRLGDAVSYRWYLGNDLIYEGPEFRWLFQGPAPREIRLEVSNDRGRSVARREVFFVEPPSRASPNRESDRRLFRRALQTHLDAVDRGVSGAWSVEHLRLVPQVLEPLQDEGLVASLIRLRPQALRQLSSEERAIVEKTRFIGVRREDPAEALRLTEEFQQRADDAAAFRWRLEALRLKIYELDRTDEAWAEIERMRGERLSDADRYELEILRGDIHRRLGRLDEADVVYREAAAMRPQEDRRQRDIPEWRESTVRSASYFVRIQQMISEQFLPEAGELLRRWEWERPRQKLQGDFIVAEAGFYLAISDYRRARTIARILRERDTVDNFLPTAVRIEALALESLADRAGLEELLEGVKESIPGHEVIETVQRSLRHVR